MGSSLSGSLCYVSEPQAGHFRFSSSRTSSIRCRRNVNLLERNVCLRIPSLQVSFPSPSKGVSGILQDHSYCTGLAKPSLVHRSAASLVCTTTSSSSQNESTVSAERKNTASKSREPASARMVTLRKGIRQKGFSVRATNHISKAVQQSTEIVYDAKWSIFVDWCVGQEIDPLKVSVQQLADFFVHLFEDKGLLPSTIKGYRSSITRTLTISGGTDLSNNEFLSLLIRNFDLKRKRLVPQWDLGLVLSSLKLPPFEPASCELRLISNLSLTNVASY